MSAINESELRMTSLITKPGNSTCADCGSSQIEMVSTKYGVFVCDQCAKFHTALPSEVKPLSTAVFTSSEVEFVNLHGNEWSRRELESTLPPFYRRPTPDCGDIIRDQFIQAKYVRREFVKGNESLQSGYAGLTKRGVLLKKLRDNNKYVERTFEFNVNENTIRYYIKPDQKDPKASLDLEKLNATFVDRNDFKVPENTMLINYIQDGSTRNIFICTDSAQTMIEWYNSIRMGKFHRLCISLCGMGQEIGVADIVDKLTYDFVVAGWLEKTGPRPGDAWRRRWCMLSRRKLMYCEDSLAPFAKGEIFVGTKEGIYDVKSGVPDNWKKFSNGFAFTLQSESRPYVFLAETKEERDRWIRALEQVLKKPVTLHETVEALAVSKKRTSTFDFLKKF